jgi:hypothetical protein
MLFARKHNEIFAQRLVQRANGRLSNVDSRLAVLIK